MQVKLHIFCTICAKKELYSENCTALSISLITISFTIFYAAFFLPDKIWIPSITRITARTISSTAKTDCA